MSFGWLKIFTMKFKSIAFIRLQNVDLMIMDIAFYMYIERLSKKFLKKCY